MPDHAFNLDGLELDLPVEWADDPDDDGGNDPSRTGNAMTGNRGSKRIAVIGSLNDDQTQEIINKIAIHTIDQFIELVEDDE